MRREGNRGERGKNDSHVFPWIRRRWIYLSRDGDAWAGRNRVLGNAALAAQRRRRPLGAGIRCEI